MIDRPWATEPNSFVPDPKLYPDLGKLIKSLHAKDVPRDDLGHLHDQ